MTHTPRAVLGSASLLASIVSLTVLANSSGFAQLLPSVSRPSQWSLGLRRAASDRTSEVDRDISEAIKSALGEYNVARLREFAKLSFGWDSGRGQPLSLSSLKSASQFLSDTGFRPDNPSVFMSADGNVVLNWLDRSNMSSIIELEFTGGEINYYIEKTDEEGSVVTNRYGFRQLINIIAPNETNPISYTPQASDDSVAIQIVSAVMA